MKRLRTLLCVLPALLAIASPAVTADKPTLRWGGDSEGNVPYMFMDPRDDKIMIGFEIDIVDALAERMGMTPKFVHNGWDNLIPGLNLGLYDIALSGLEITPEHKEEVDFSLPYYKTFLQLVV